MSSDNGSSVQDERQAQYGDFDDTALIYSELMYVFLESGLQELPFAQKYAITQIAVKLSRILNAGANHKDNWVDIAGYAQKVLEGFDR